MNIGRYEHRKGRDLLVRAFARVMEKWTGVHLAIVGAMGPEFEKTKALVQDIGLPHVIRYCDLPHSATPRLLGSVELFVLSSRWVPGSYGEGFPVAFLEAAAGKPVVTTRTCGAAEIIEDGVTGRLVPLENVDVLAEAICERLHNPEQARLMADNLRRKVQDKFTWKQAYQSTGASAKRAPWT